MTDFARALEFVLKWEGGSAYTNDPDDPGGETKFGISKKSYPAEDIKNLTELDAHRIYFHDYWLKAGCYALKWPLNLCVFDAAVNQGVRRSLGFLSESKDYRDFLLCRIAHYVRLAKRKRLRQYLRGWLNRVMDLNEYARKPIGG
jgi:lysozyme family protein